MRPTARNESAGRSDDHRPRLDCTTLRAAALGAVEAVSAVPVDPLERLRVYVAGLLHYGGALAAGRSRQDYAAVHGLLAAIESEIERLAGWPPSAAAGRQRTLAQRRDGAA